MAENQKRANKRGKRGLWKTSIERNRRHEILIQKGEIQEYKDLSRDRGRNIQKRGAGGGGGPVSTKTNSL